MDKDNKPEPKTLEERVADLEGAVALQMRGLEMLGEAYSYHQKIIEAMTLQVTADPAEPAVN
jgi:uncharacterized coiled-coil protein SlyX